MNNHTGRLCKCTESNVGKYATGEIRYLKVDVGFWHWRLTCGKEKCVCNLESQTSKAPEYSNGTRSYTTKQNKDSSSQYLFIGTRVIARGWSMSSQNKTFRCSPFMVATSMRFVSSSVQYNFCVNQSHASPAGDISPVVTTPTCKKLAIV
jgi:hypothetical protein